MTNLKLPAFGRPTTSSEFESLFGCIQAETILCTRTTPRDSYTDTINILHASTDVESAAVEIDQMVSFMEQRGFDVKRRPDQHDWPNANMLVLDMGKRGLPDMDKVADIIIRVAGLMQEQDVLFYGVNCDEVSWSGDPAHPLCVGWEFGFEGCCMLHNYIRNRDNPHFWPGFYVFTVGLFEAHIDHIIGRDGKNIKKKIDRVVDVLGGYDRDSQDIELFRAAAHMIREVRNACVHLPYNTSSQEMGKWRDRLDCAMDGFDKAVKCSGRNDLLIGRPISGDPLSVFNRYCARVALAASRWIYYCHKLVPANTNR